MTLRGTMISMPMSDGAGIGVYRVEPVGPRRGGLLLIQEIFGVTSHQGAERPLRGARLRGALRRSTTAKSRIQCRLWC